MPEQRDSTIFYESGRATAPPGVCYTSLAGSTSEGYSHTVATTPSSANPVDQSTNQSSQYSSFYTNFAHQKSHCSPCYPPPEYSPCSSPNLTYHSSVTKTNSSNLPIQPTQCSNNYLPSNLHSSNSSTTSHALPCNTLNYNSNGNNIGSNNNFDFPSTSKNSSKCQNTSLLNQELTPPAGDHYYYPKISKSNTTTPFPKHNSNHSNFSYFSNNSIENTTEDSSKKDNEIFQKPLKVCREDAESIGNIGDIQQFFSKHGPKLKNSSDTSSDLVTDSLLHFLQKKTSDKNTQDNFSFDLGEFSQILLSLTSIYKSEEVSGFKKKEGIEDSKLMNDFLSKLLLEKEEKRFKSLDEKKSIGRKEAFDDFSIELDAKKIKRDAMSHYQEDKSHHKRSTNYGDFNQWDFLNQQEIQASNNHNRRGHFSFGGTSQAHSMGWNPMNMGVSRQTNPYYSNPHSHMMPAHAHSEYRYNQWNNPSHKNVPNIHNAHSQNTVMPQSRVDMKLHSDLTNMISDYGLPVGSAPDFSKLRNPTTGTPHHPTLPDKSGRTSGHPEHIGSITPTIRNPTLKLPNLSTHPKTVISNPLSDLQMLATIQEAENPPQKPDSYQQESVDLSAHSEVTKHKENSIKEVSKVVNENNVQKKDFTLPGSVTETQNQKVNSDPGDLCEKPVELTSKNCDKNFKTENSTSVSLSSSELSVLNEEKSVHNKTENAETKTSRNTKNPEKQQMCDKDNVSSVSNDNSKESIPKNKESETSDGIGKVTDGNQTDSIKHLSNTTNESQTAKQETEGIVELSKDDGDKQEISAAAPVENQCKGGSPEKNSEGCQNGKRKAEDALSNGENKKSYLEVESQLESVSGAGEENSDLPTVSSTSVEIKPTGNESAKKTPKKKPSRKSRAARLSSGQSSGSETHFYNKKFKGFSGKEDSKKKLKKNLCDVVDRRGPFLHLEGSKESPSSVTVINFPKGDDEDEKDKNSIKKLTSNAIRNKHQLELDYRGRSKNGLFSSTLSSRYDAHTTDHTWVCVFCKKGPHFNTLGDLFGPYIISKDESNSCHDFSGDEKDISDAQKRGGRNKKSLRSNNMVEHFQKMSKKLRKVQSSDSCLTGMIVISNDQVDQLRYEVWVHEQCAVWSPNVCLIGSRLVGMQEAIWSSHKTMCSKCGFFGANIGCVFRNCPNRSHYYCAKENGWSLEQETFISTCQIHKPRS